MDTARFTGHQSFSLRNTWLTKGVLACAHNPSIFREDDALVTLGVGKNMVDAIKYWCLATRVLEDHVEQRYDLQPTELGRKLFVSLGGWDPYLEDKGSLWLLHWLLATNAEIATTIYWAFNHLPGLEFSRASLYQAMAKLSRTLQVRATSNTLRRDINVFVRSYAGGQDRSVSSVEDRLDCPLAELGLLQEDEVSDSYAFTRGPKDSLPDAVFFHALCAYSSQTDGRSTLSFDELAYFPGSPGRVFKLDERALAERLERLADVTHGAWQLTETAGYRQVTIRHALEASDLLEEYYG